MQLWTSSSGMNTLLIEWKVQVNAQAACLIKRPEEQISKLFIYFIDVILYEVNGLSGVNISMSC